MKNCISHLANRQIPPFKASSRHHARTVLGKNIREILSSWILSIRVESVFIYSRAVLIARNMNFGFPIVLFFPYLLRRRHRIFSLITLPRERLEVVLGEHCLNVGRASPTLAQCWGEVGCSSNVLRFPSNFLFFTTAYIYLTSPTCSHVSHISRNKPSSVVHSVRLGSRNLERVWISAGRMFVTVVEHYNVPHCSETWGLQCCETYRAKISIKTTAFFQSLMADYFNRL